MTVGHVHQFRALTYSGVALTNRAVAEALEGKPL